jgi:CHASE3 domain sensor protein
MKIEVITTIICITLVVLALIGGTTYYNLNKARMYTETVNTATQKGVDPMAVRCSLTDSVYDQICLVYAATSKK